MSAARLLESSSVVGSQYVCAAPDWSQIPKRDMQVFHPRGATHEWVMMKSSHSGRAGLTKGESCIACHEGKTGLDIDLKKLAGKDLEPVGAPRTMIFPVSVQAAFDDANLHIRLTFKAPADAAASASREEESPRHDVKVAIMFAGATVEQSVPRGCWMSCHNDVRSMPGADPKKKKYIEHADLAGGVFYDYMQWKSGEAGKGATQIDGHVAGEKGEQGRQGPDQGGRRTARRQLRVTFVRKLAGRNVDGDLELLPGRRSRSASRSTPIERCGDSIMYPWATPSACALRAMSRR
ncbi:MAG: ethylbenzene dehydrogenase-related protein [Comamonadaceae bacterium]|nr:ethylbenzene dehydrogenase-related protein [Comamonadaceae bacterium]